MFVLARAQLCRSLFLSRSQAARALAASHTAFTRQLSTRPLLSPAPRFFTTSRVSREDGQTEARNAAHPTPTKTLYVGNIPYHVADSDIRDLFSPFGEVENIRMGMLRDGRSKGYAHVDFVKLEDAVAAFQSSQVEPFWLQNRTLLLDYAKGPSEQANRKPAPHNVLYFRHFDGDLHTMQTILNNYAHDIISIDFLEPKEPGRSPNHGRITFRSEPRATAALEELNGKVLENGLKMDLEYGHNDRGGRFSRDGRNNRDGRPSQGGRNNRDGGPSQGGRSRRGRTDNMRSTYSDSIYD